MQNQNEITKINRFLTMVSPVITEIVKKILQSLSCEVVRKGDGLDMVFLIKAGEKQMEFYLHNLFMEIATVDRDEEPLRFDENLRDFDYFLAKTARVVASKLNVLFKLLGAEDVDTALDSISQLANQYERIRIWRIDPNKSSANSGN